MRREPIGECLHGMNRYIIGMVRIPKYILIVGMIFILACVGYAAAAVPQACAQCSPDTYPGSEICPIACRIVFPDDAEWTYPIAANVTPEEEEEEIPDYLISILSGTVLEMPPINPLISPLSGTDLSTELSIDPFISPLSGTNLNDQVAEGL